MGLFSNKDNDKDKGSNQRNYENDQGFDMSISPEQQQEIFQRAQQASVMQSGNDVAFETALNNEASVVRQKVLTDTAFQEARKGKYNIMLADLRGEKESLEKLKIQIEDKVLRDCEDQINKCEISISDAPNNPSKYGIASDTDPSTKSLFYIGCIILATVGVFLAVFYMSATYAAFFKDWALESELGLTSKIFDSQAFVKAWQQSVTAGLMVSLSVFIFLGLGVLIHVFQKQKGNVKWIKVLFLVAITFVFDCLLAYYIENKVYDANKGIMDPPFGLETAFETVGFWIIIFFGFVTYFIWGLVFDFTMDKWSKFSPLLVFIEGKKKEKALLEKEKKVIQKKIQEKSKEIASLNIQIEKTLEELNTLVMPLSHLKTYIDAYAKGWIFGIAGTALSEEMKNDTRNNCKIVLHSFLKSNRL